MKISKFVTNSSQIHQTNLASYSRKVGYLTGNNRIFKRLFECTIKKAGEKEDIKIWNLKFRVTKFKENCNYNGLKITNTYYLDNKQIIRQSHQYHSETLGYIFTQRLDR